MAPVTITYIGHSTLLIAAGNEAVITDPNFGTRILTQKRLQPLPLNPGQIPPVAAILLSHTHFDHLHFDSLKYFSTTTTIFTPEGTAKTVTSLLPNPVIELSPWASHSLSDTLKIAATPAKHCGGRYIGFRLKGATGYIIQIGGKTIFFAGDSGYGKHFQEIGSAYNIDCALLPIGGYSPRFLFNHFHMNPKEALQAAFDLKAKLLIPIHFGTFKLSLEPTNEPAKLLQQAAEKTELTELKVKILDAGQSFEI